MISYLKGKVKLAKDDFVILEVGGVGFRVYGSPKFVFKLKDSAEAEEIFVYQHIREDSQELFGFQSFEELEFFEVIISVSGVGPRVGLAIMESSTVADIKKAIATSNVDFLTRVPGIGRKKAELIILELKNKMDVLVGGSDSLQISNDEDSINALVRLGYNSREAREALQSVPKDIKDPGERVKIALKNIGKV